MSLQVPMSDELPESPAPRYYADYVRADRNPAPDHVFERSIPELDDYTVDARHYTSKAWAQLEADKLWPTVWQMACRENELREVGDYVEYSILQNSVLVVRSDESTIKAFHNACRHRGTALAVGSGNVSCFNCPFHGWSYGLDGALEDVPGHWDFEHMDFSRHGMREIRAESFDGWVFVNFDTAAPPLLEYLGEPIVRQLSATRPDAQMVKTYHFQRVIQCNWKALQETFIEIYHLARTHPQLAPYVGDIFSQYDTFGLHSRLLTPAGVPSGLAGGDYTEQEVLDELLESSESVRHSAEYQRVEVPLGSTARELNAGMIRAQWEEKGLDLSDVSDSELQDGMVYLLFPNFVLFQGAAGHFAYRIRPNGDDPNTAIYEIFELLPVAPGAEFPRDATCTVVPADQLFSEFEPSASAMGGLAGILDQDVRNTPLIQRGLHGLDTLVMGKRQEANIVAYHRNLEAWMGVNGDSWANGAD